MRSLPLLCAGAALAFLGTAAAQSPGDVPPPPFRAAYLPKADEEVLQEVPSVSDPSVAQMQALRAAFNATPRNLPAAQKLADAYIDYSRQIGDAHFAGYAEAVIEPWLQAAQPPASALVIEAVILQYRHEFTPARALLQRALAEDHANAQAWLTLGTLDMVQGDYESAVRDCAQVSNHTSLEIGLACIASVRSYTGQAHQSLIALRQVETAMAKAPANYRGWVEGLIAESAERLGDWNLAEAHYKKAIEAQPQDNFLLVAYADFLLDRGRPQEVSPLLSGHAQSDTAFLRLALAAAALHPEQAPRYTWIMAARFEALRLRGSEYFGREESRFALHLEHDPKTALEMALRNWQIQRAPWDARVVLEAALAANDADAARPVLAFIEKTKLEDPVLEPLAGKLRLKLNQARAGS